jgi:hypothetical protein
MEPARKIDPRGEASTADCADLFLAELVAETGVSARFAQAARPALVKAFTEVDAERRDPLLDQVRELFRAQAETEGACRGSLEALGRLERSQQEMCQELVSARAQMIGLRDRLVGEAFAACPFTDDQITSPRARA